MNLLYVLTGLTAIVMYIALLMWVWDKNMDLPKYRRISLSIVFACLVFFPPLLLIAI